MNVHFKNFMKYKFLLKELVVSDIKIKYRRSMLGIMWSVLHPLMLMVVLTIVFSSLFKSNIPNFPVYVLTGRMIWDLYYQSTVLAMSSVISNASLMKKVYIPKYIFPLSKCLFVFINTIFSLGALLIVMLITKSKFTLVFFLFPLPLFYLLIFSIGVGLILSVYTVFFRDLSYIYEVIMMALMYLTPLFYPIDIIPAKYHILITVNPLYYMVKIFRKIVLYGQVPTLNENLLCLGISLITLLIGIFIFNKNQDKFILYI